MLKRHTDFYHKVLLTGLFATILGGMTLAPTYAQTSFSDANSTLKQALEAQPGTTLFGNEFSSGFSLSSSTFSGSANGRQAMPGLNQATDLVGDQRVYALLVDGKYDFKYDNGIETAWHPYLSGGAGVAMFGKPIGTSASNGLSGDTAPLLRMGGGVAYRLDQKWNMDLNYTAGITGKTGTSDHIFTGRGQESVDMHAINMGMKYKF